MGEMFATDEPAAGLRRQRALRLRQHIAHLTLIAEHLEGPQVDERGSDRAGWDAKHSVL